MMQKSFSDFAWRSNNDLRLYARDYAGESSKLPVVCIPGMTRNSRDFEDVAPWIAAQGRRVLAVDLRGRGRSDRDKDPTQYAVGVYARDVLALLDAIGAPRAVFIGTSLGGFVTMAIAAQQPSAIGAAVLNDIGPEIPEDARARIAAYIGKPVSIQDWDEAAEYARQTMGVAFPHYNSEQWRTMARRAFVEVDHRLTLDYDPNIFGEFPSTDVMWRAFNALAQAGPVLVLRGETSDILTNDTWARMRREAPGSQNVEVAKVGHAPMLDEPDAKNALAAFLAATP
jgi:pimeloyl-ACP methyl ester carboxylesterase